MSLIVCDIFRTFQALYASLSNIQIFGCEDEGGKRKTRIVRESAAKIEKENKLGQNLVGDQQGELDEW